MAQNHFQTAKEVQLDQLPEGTEVQVRPVPLAFAYKKLEGQWTPIETHPGVYRPLIGDEFSLGSIAIDPNGIGYVKGFGHCPHHSAGTHCLCMRPVRWLRVGLIHSPPLPLSNDVDLAAHPAGPDDDILMGAVVPAQGFNDNFPEAEPDLPNVDAMDNYPPRPYFAAEAAYDYSTGNSNDDFNYHTISAQRAEQPLFMAPVPDGGSEEIHQVLNDLQVSGIPAMQHPRPSDTADDELQDVRLMDGPDRCTIYFNPEGGGVPLTSGDINALNTESPAFRRAVSLNMKVCIRFKFKYWQSISDLREHIDKRKQVNVRHGSKDGNPISLRAMAKLVLSELTAEMKNMADLNYPLCHRGVPVQVEQLVLVRIERIKTGTLQPVFILRQ